MFVAILQEWIFGRDFAQAIGMRIHQMQFFAAAASGFRLRRFHRVQHRVQHVQRITTIMRANGSAPCSFHAIRPANCSIFRRSRRG